MKILVINSGSSSIKYQLFDMHSGAVLTSGQVERIGEPESQLLHCWQDAQGEAKELTRSEPLADHQSAFQCIGAAMRESGTVEELAKLSGIGHRVVHGGEKFQAPTVIDKYIVETIRDMCSLAPLHNPANLTGIEVCLELFPQAPQVAVFDTAFHQSMPAYAYRYAVPEQWYSEHGVRRYGFHGTSHAYVARRAADYLQQPLASLNLITLHLGNGASAAALSAGHCVDTSMGLTPLEGLIMGTRCGDIDPAILFYVSKETGVGMAQLESLLNKESGLKGVCGINDMREIQQLAESGDLPAQLAIEMYSYRIKKYIGAYYAVLGQVDALVFTAGVGENSPLIRKRACAGLDGLGIVIDNNKNETHGGAAFEIQSDAATVKTLVIPTNEELEIAQQAAACIQALD